jgi:predicted glutamine amidotransferase
MCLLVTQSTTSPVLSNDWLIDFHASNSDGVGVMYSSNNEIIIQKILPKSAQDFIEFYHSSIKGKNCAFHLRMKTHGDIDLENCHPYEVLNRADHGIDLWLMHNGVLSTGNKADTSKSDTWHYIRDYLRPMLIDNPEFAFHPSFSDIVGKHIGSSNKFVLMDEQGRQAVINQSSGVFWAGLWLSNTYAWSASKNVSDKPSNSAKEAKAQAKEKPEKYSSTPKSYSYYDSRLDDYYDGEYRGASSYKSLYDDEYEYAPRHVFEDDFYIAIEELEANGFWKASSLSFTQAMRFVNQFDEGAFFDLLYSCIDGDIIEDDYWRSMHDFKFARDAFPFLNRLSDIAYANDKEIA